MSVSLLLCIKNEYQSEFVSVIECHLYFAKLL